jgi:hypothetical protein
MFARRNTDLPVSKAGHLLQPRKPGPKSAAFLAGNEVKKRLARKAVGEHVEQGGRREIRFEDTTPRIGEEVTIRSKVQETRVCPGRSEIEEPLRAQRSEHLRKKVF